MVSCYWLPAQNNLRRLSAVQNPSSFLQSPFLSPTTILPTQVFLFSVFFYYYGNMKYVFVLKKLVKNHMDVYMHTSWTMLSFTGIKREIT